MYTLVQQGVANALVIGSQELGPYHSEANYLVDHSTRVFCRYGPLKDSAGLKRL
jgi:hypothetical protein